MWLCWCINSYADADAYADVYPYADTDACWCIYILVNGKRAITGAGNDADARRADERSKGVISKNFAPFTKRMSKISNTEIDNAQDIDMEMRMYNLIEYSDNYSETSGSVWRYYKDDPSVNVENSEWFKFLNFYWW